MSRRYFIKMLLSVVTVFVASVVGLWKWMGSGIKAGEQPVSPAVGPPPLEKNEPVPTPEPVAPSTEPLLSFMILSDTHVNNYNNEQSDKLKKAYDDILEFEHKIDTLLITGDITESGSDGDYKEWNNIMNTKKYKSLPPLHVNMGNHDYYNIWLDKNGQWNQEAMPNGKSDAQSRQTFMKQFGMDKVYHDFHVNGHHIIMLSQEAYQQEKPEVGEGAWHSDEQFAWFRQKMEQHRDGSPVFVMIHQPLPAKGQDGGSHSFIRAKEFRSILEPYSNVFVFSGHRHQNFRTGQHYTPETFHWFHNASVGRTRGTASPNSNNTLTSQGLFVQVFADRVELRGREFIDRTWISEANWSIPLIRA